MAFYGNNLSSSVKFLRVSPAVAAGTTLITPASGVNLAGFQGVLFVGLFNTLAAGAVTSMKAQGSYTNGVSDAYADIASSHITVPQADSNMVALIDVYRPLKPWVLPVIVRGTGNATVDGILAILYGAENIPTVNDAATIIGLTLVTDSTPAGTA